MYTGGVVGAKWAGKSPARAAPEPASSVKRKIAKKRRVIILIAPIGCESMTFRVLHNEYGRSSKTETSAPRPSRRNLSHTSDGKLWHGGCGKKPGMVDPPPEVTSDTFPRTYPDPAMDPKP